MDILHLEPEAYPPDALDRLRAVGRLDLLPAADRVALLDRLEQRRYDAIFTRLGSPIDAAVLDRQPHLRFVVTPTTGLDHVDLDEAERRGIHVISLAGEDDFLATVRSTAEHTWALLLALVRRVPTLAGQVSAGEWERAGRQADELDGKTLGIVGYGRLGRMTARYGVAFGMRVLTHDRSPSREGAPHVEHRALDELLAESDVVSLHIPGSRENRGFLDAGRLAGMKPGALLVNTARGEIVDEAALLRALEEGRLAGAALDVLAGDSAWDGRVPDGHPLVEYARCNENLVITPHVGGYGRRSIQRTRAFVTKRFLEACGAPGGARPPAPAGAAP
jgi:D-3-phosphoglycerate dehydrogenase / 2-oxoglutarate reductase